MRLRWRDFDSGPCPIAVCWLPHPFLGLERVGIGAAFKEEE